MQRVARITAREWSSLTNHRILNPCVQITGCVDIHPYPKGPIFDATTVHIADCDKNFVFYWLKHSTFPRIRQIYLASHPCEPEVFYRFPQANFPIRQLAQLQNKMGG
jgi:hypothetical protein